MLSLKRLEKLMEGRLKSWDDCRCGRLVGKVQFCRTQQEVPVSGVSTVLIPQDANEEWVIRMIENVIQSSNWTDSSSGQTYNANRALYSSGDNPTNGFFLFLSHVEEGKCDC